MSLAAATALFSSNLFLCISKVGFSHVFFGVIFYVFYFKRGFLAFNSYVFLFLDKLQEIYNSIFVGILAYFIGNLHSVLNRFKEMI
jgi:hypothetical protein